MRFIDEEIRLLYKELTTEMDTDKARMLVQRLNEARGRRDALMLGIHRSIQSTPVESLAEPEASPKKSAKKKKKKKTRKQNRERRSNVCAAEV